MKYKRHHTCYWPVVYSIQSKQYTCMYMNYLHCNDKENALEHVVWKMAKLPRRQCGNLLQTRCTWWRHQMETFSALLAICAGNSPVSGEFPAQRPVTRSFDVFFHLRLDGRLSKHSWGWWLETPSCPFRRQSNEHPTAATWKMWILMALSVSRKRADDFVGSITFCCSLCK